MSIAQLQEDVATLKKGEAVCDEARELIATLQNEIGYTQEECVEWNDDVNMNVEMMEGLMKCFDSAGLFWGGLLNKDFTSFFSFASTEWGWGFSRYWWRGGLSYSRYWWRGDLSYSLYWWRGDLSYSLQRWRGDS